MWSYTAGVCLLLAACEPVLLEGEGTATEHAPSSITPKRDAGADAHRVATASAGADASAAQTASPEPVPDSSMSDLDVQLVVTSVACGSCFELIAAGKGGMPPYHYEWEDGSTASMRRVCVGSSGKDVWVVAKDATSASSRAQITRLQVDDTQTADCTQMAQPKMCLMNPSFEGTPTVNTGQLFDAVPWTQCTAATDNNTANTPDIVNASVDPGTGVAPNPTDGDTYLTLTDGEQASQALCETLNGGSKRSIKLDLTRLDLGAGSEGIILEIWGGVAVDCSQRQLLWVSPKLDPKWKTYCVTLQPTEFMDQITLRAHIPNQTVVVNYLAVDNIVPVDSCP